MLALRPTHGKLHWHDLNPRERKRVSTAISGLDALHLVVIASPIDPRREERARALCLERLGWELAQHDVTRLTLEARSRHLMDRDVRTVRALRGRRVIPAALRVEHGDPEAEPMLWLPDQVLSAFGLARSEGRELDGRLVASIETFAVRP